MCFSTMFARILFSFFGVIAIALAQNCRIQSQRCEFPFTYEGEKFTYCTTHNATGDDLICVSSHDGGNWSWGICSSECMEDDGVTPMDFGGEMQSASVFCKVKPVDCVFPFIYENTEYNECTSANSDFLWCSTHVDEYGVMIENMWGKCDLDSCTKEDLPDSQALSTAKTAHVIIDDGVITADIQFSQDSENLPIIITGSVAGLQPGLHGLHIHEYGDISDNCSNAGLHYNPTNNSHGSLSGMIRHIGDLGNIEADSDGNALIDINTDSTSLFGKHSVYGRSLVISADMDDFGLTGEDNSMSDGNSGPPVACGLISAGETSEWPLTLIIIIVLAVAIIILLILITILICYCIKKSKKGKIEKCFDEEGLPLQNGNGNYKKTPLYDELSIPFIDATPTNTPKMGRSFDRLSSFFSRNTSVGRSRGSLASND